MKHVCGYLLLLIFSLPGFAQEQAQPQDLNILIKAITEGSTALQQSLLKGKRYQGLILVNDVSQTTRSDGKMSKPIAVIESFAMSGAVVVSFSIDDLERAAKINKRSKLAITGTFDSVVHRPSGYINVPGYDEVKLVNVVIEDGRDK